jgi:hypothetical protein
MNDRWIDITFLISGRDQISISRLKSIHLADLVSAPKETTSTPVEA